MFRQVISERKVPLASVLRRMIDAPNLDGALAYAVDRNVRHGRKQQLPRSFDKS